MRYTHIITFLLIAATLAGCSTGPYLKPIASNGVYKTVNPACPGAERVLEYAAENQKWVVFRVYAKLPGDYQSKGTEIHPHFRLAYLNDQKPLGVTSIMLMDSKAIEDRNKIIKERSRLDYIATATKPTATIILPSGRHFEVAIPIFQKPYDIKNDRDINWWGPGVPISSERLDEFIVIFPDIYVNDEKINIPEIHFKIDKDYYAPVLNC